MTIQKDSKGTVAAVITFCILMLALTVFFLHSLWVVIPVSIILLWMCWFIVFFFRVPTRVRSDEDNIVTSVADGKIVIIDKVYEAEYLKRECIQVSVYMDFFSVHTNFWPFDGITTYYKYHPGKYLLAFLPKSSLLNEHASVAVKPKGSDTEILFKQIAGTFARRIVNYAQPGTTFTGGEQCGVIKFGSRLDMFLPLDAEICVSLGEEVKSITSVIARLK